MEILSVKKQEAVRLIRDQLCCMLCNQIFEDPQCLDCKHNFCRDCIYLHLKKNKSYCPRCRLPTQPSEVTRNQFLQSILVAWKTVEQELTNLADPEQSIALTAADTDRVLQQATAGAQLSSVHTNGASASSSSCSSVALPLSMQSRGPVANNKWNIDTTEIRNELKMNEEIYGYGISPMRTKTTSWDGMSSASLSAAVNNRTTVPNAASHSTMRTPPRRANGTSKRSNSQSSNSSQSSQSHIDSNGNGYSSQNGRLSAESPPSSSFSSPGLMETQEVETYLNRIKRQKEALLLWEQQQKRLKSSTSLVTAATNGKPVISALERMMKSSVTFSTGQTKREIFRSTSEKEKKSDDEGEEEDDDDEDCSQTQMPKSDVMDSPGLFSMSTGRNSAHTSLFNRQPSGNSDVQAHRPMVLDEDEDSFEEKEAISQLKKVGTKQQAVLSSPASSIRKRSRKRLLVPNSQPGDEADSEVVDDSQKTNRLGEYDEYEMKPAVPLVTASEASQSQLSRKKKRISEDFQGAIMSFNAQQSAPVHNNTISTATKVKKGILNTIMMKSLGVSEPLANGGLTSPVSTAKPPLRAKNTNRSGAKNSTTKGECSFVFVGTDVSREESKRILLACQTLGGRFGRDFDLKRDLQTGTLFTSVTHLITKSVQMDAANGGGNGTVASSDGGLRCKRTAKYMRALAEGTFVVDYSWVEASLKAGQWVPEEPYEMVGDIYSDAIGKPHESRRRRLQTGRRNDIFSMFRFVLLCDVSDFDFQFESVQNIVETFGGSVMLALDYMQLGPNHQTRKTPIGFVSKKTTPWEAKAKWQQHQIPIVRVTWIFDSISHLEVLPFDDYYPY